MSQAQGIRGQCQCSARAFERLGSAMAFLYVGNWRDLNGHRFILVAIDYFNK